MPRGANPKREREYEELKEKFEESGRYKGREEEVAARIVNKQRRMYGETKGEKAKDRRGTSFRRRRSGRSRTTKRSTRTARRSSRPLTSG